MRNANQDTHVWKDIKAKMLLLYKPENPISFFLIWGVGLLLLPHHRRVIPKRVYKHRGAWQVPGVGLAVRWERLSRRELKKGMQKKGTGFIGCRKGLRKVSNYCNIRSISWKLLDQKVNVKGEIIRNKWWGEIHEGEILQSLYWVCWPEKMSLLLALQWVFLPLHLHSSPCVILAFIIN